VREFLALTFENFVESQKKKEEQFFWRRHLRPFKMVLIPVQKIFQSKIREQKQQN